MSIAVHGIVDGPTGTGQRRRRIDVTGLTLSELQSSLDSLIETDDIGLEYRRDRTYVVIDQGGSVQA